MTRICIIPARSGSKRIPKKAIKSFHGKPIMSYSIVAALDSNLFDEVMVSTDSEEFAKIGRDYGASTPFLRSEENSNDHATTLDAIEEVLEQYRNLGQVFDEVCCLYPAAPLVSAQILQQGFEKLAEGYTSVFAALRYGHPIQRAFKLVNGEAKMFDAQYQNTRSQDLEPAYHDAGQFYCFKADAVLKEGSIFTSKCTFVLLNEYQAQDIDNEDDWQMAELKYKLRTGK